MNIDVRDNIDQVLGAMERYRRDVVDKAISRALNRTGEMARTAASKEMRSEGYAFSAAEIKQAISQLKASPGRLTTTLRVKRTTKSLMGFSPRQTKDGVTVKILGKPKLIKGAFIGQLRNGRMGVYIEAPGAGKTVLRQSKQYKRGSRGGWHDKPVRKLFGPSVGGSYSTKRVQRTMSVMISTTFVSRLAHEIKFLSR